MRGITEAARRRMIRATRDALARNLTGGELWFRLDGTGGAWHSGNAMPTDRKHTIIVRLAPGADPAELVEAAIQSWQTGQA